LSQMLHRSLEAKRLREDRDGGRAHALVFLPDLGRIELAPQEARRRGRPLDLGDDAEGIAGRAPEGGDEGARVAPPRLRLAPELHRGNVQRLALQSLAPFARDRGEKIRHHSTPSFRDTAMKRSSTWSARRASICSAASGAASASVDAAPAIQRAAAAFKTSASRRGPRSPESTAR